MPETALTHKRSSQRRPLSLLFTTEANDGSFFVTPELAQRFHLILHLIQHSEQLLLILADQGSGKSTLLHQIKSSANPDWKLFTLVGQPAINEERLLKNLLNVLNVRSDGKTLATLRETLRSHIAATRYNNQLPVLLVDDAHMLPLDTLHLLLDLVMNGEKQTRLRLVLFCEPQITSVLAAAEFSQVRNTLIHTLDIPALDEKQVGEYLRFRLEEGRFQKNNPFSGMAVRSLYEQSEGRLGRLNPLAQHIINQKLEEQLQSREDMPSMTPRSYKIAWVLGLAALFGGLLFGLQWVKYQWAMQETLDPNREILSLPQTQPLDSEMVGDAVLPTLHPELLKPSSAEENQGLPPPETKTEVTHPPVQENLGNVPVQAEKTAPTADAATQTEVPQTNTKPADTAPSTAPPPVRNGSEYSGIAGVKSAAWLSQQNTQAYSIQILGATDLESIARFIRQQAVSGELALYLTQHNNHDWYVLTYGIYASREQAQQALRQLPTKLRNQTNPWIRSLSSVQQAIAERPQ